MGTTRRQYTKILPVQELGRASESLAVVLCNARPASILFPPSSYPAQAHPCILLQEFVVSLLFSVHSSCVISSLLLKTCLGFLPSSLPPSLCQRSPALQREHRARTLWENWGGEVARKQGSVVCLLLGFPVPSSIGGEISPPMN